MSGAPSGPWALRGEAIWFIAGRRGSSADLPDGIRAVPGPCALTAARYTGSPIGPFLALTFARPARCGARIGWCTTAMVVSNQVARASVQSWGFPAEIGELRWLARGDECTFVWENRDFLVRARGRGPRIPMMAPHPDLLLSGDTNVRVPDRLWARFRAARVRVHARDDDDLSWLAGVHAGAHASGVERVLGDVRLPVQRPVLQSGPSPGLADTVRREGSFEPVARTRNPVGTVR